MQTFEMRSDQERSRAGRRTQRVPGRGRTVWNAVTTLRNDTKAEYFYIYAGDDPINSIDPSGQSFCSVAKWFSVAVSLGCNRRVRHFALHTAPHFARRHWAEIVQAGAACWTVGSWGSVWGTYVAPEYGGTVIGAVGGCLVGAGADLAGADLEPPDWKR